MQKVVLTLIFVGLMGTACGGDDGPPPTMDAAVSDMRDQPDTPPSDMSQPDEGTEDCEDEDGDGFDAAHCGGRDCDDSDPFRFPGNPERCSGVLPDGRGAATHDEDCNPCTFTGAGVIDGDADSDRYLAMTCSNAWPSDTAPIGCDPTLSRIDEAMMLVTGTDCADDNPDVHPNQPEVCGDGLDNNCDGGTDMGTLYRDLDNDGRGNPEIMMTGACALGWVLNDEDCNDDQALVYEGAIELCDRMDNDCSSGGGVDASEDMDEDGHAPDGATCIPLGEASGAQFPIGDCNDADPTTYLGAPEICGDDIDNNCNRVVDDAMPRICPDVDGDGFGDPDRSTWTFGTTCAVPEGWTGNCGILGGRSFEDCDDTEALRNPEATEWCNGVNDNCDAISGVAEDADGDRHSPIGAVCEGADVDGAPALTYPRDDCADTDGTIHPGATELCDGVDSDCSEGNGGVSLTEDADGDGYSPVGVACTGGLHPGIIDCDDHNGAVNPGVVEDLGVCDAIDNDCDSTTAERTHQCDSGGYCDAGGTCRHRYGVLSIAVTDFHACVLYQSGEVFCWGENSSGGAGLGGDRPRPAQVDSLQNVIGISAAGKSTCAVLATGGVQCLGNISPGPHGVATDVAGIGTATRVSIGDQHGCAVLADARVACWGHNSGGELGDGTFVSRNEAVPIAGLTQVQEVAAGLGHTCALTADGSMWCWGRNHTGPLGDGTTTHRPSPVRVPIAHVTSMSVGANHSCAITATGTLCWGQNNSGQLGDGTVVDQHSPTASSLGSTLALGWLHSCTVLGGHVSCIGSNSSGQLGAAAPVPNLSDIRLLVAQGSRTCAVSGDVVSCWGGGSTEVVEMPSQTPQHIATSGSHTCAALGTGDVVCWGANGDGRLGNGTIEPSLSPALASSLDDATSVAAGQVSCAVTEAGRVECWGWNGHRLLGHGAAVPRSLVPLEVPNLRDIRSVRLGLSACALSNAGRVFCWGGPDEFFERGDGNGTTTPLSFTSAVSFDVGVHHACAVLSSGDVRCWGRNLAGELGDGTTTNRRTAVVVGELGMVQSVALGGHHSCALLSDGTVWCWGGNAHGQLGNGSISPTSVPTRVPSLSDVASIAAGFDTTCAIREDEVYCWGANEHGQLGDGSLLERHVPILVTGISAARHLTVGNGVVCAVTPSASYCWGNNGDGALGDGTRVTRPRPTPIWDL